MENKLYKSYLVRISQFTKAQKIKLSFTKSGPWLMGVWFENRREIRVDRSLKAQVKIATILHELGHVLDDATLKSDFSRRLSLAYSAFYKDKGNDSQKELIMACEVRAWNYGKFIAKLLRIPLNTRFYKIKRNCLNAYRKDFSK